MRHNRCWLALHPLLLHLRHCRAEERRQATSLKRAQLELFDELHDEGKTILLVTHEPEVGSRAEKVLRLKDGLIDEVQDNRVRG